MKLMTAVFKALADPTRREIIVLLRDSEMTAGELVKQFKMTAPSISKHLLILKNAELVSERKDGNKRFYSAESNRVTSCLNDFINTICPNTISKKVMKNRADK